MNNLSSNKSPKEKAREEYSQIHRDFHSMDEPKSPEPALSDEEIRKLLWWLQDSINSILKPSGNSMHAGNLQVLHDYLIRSIDQGREG